jgi:hypothetical protein
MSANGQAPDPEFGNPSVSSDDNQGPFLSSPPAPWGPGTFASELTRLIRRLTVWHVTDFQSPIKTIQTGPEYWLLTSRTFGEITKGFDERPLGASIRVFGREEGGELGACVVPEQETDQTATQWLLARFGRHLEGAPNAPAFEYLCGLFRQLMELPAWEGASAEQVGMYGLEEGALVLAGRPIPDGLLRDLERAVERLLETQHGTGSLGGQTNLRSGASGRHVVFRAIRQRFEDAANRFPDFKIYPVKLHDAQSLGLPAILTSRVQASGHGTTQGGCGSWSVINGDEREFVEANGPTAAFRLWEELATEAGASLGEDRHRLRPVLPFGSTRILRTGPAGLWSNFVFHTLSDAGGMHVGIVEREDQRPLRQIRATSGRRSAQAAEDDRPAFATYAFTVTGIFRAAVLAIDFAGLAEPPSVNPVEPTTAAPGAAVMPLPPVTDPVKPARPRKVVPIPDGWDLPTEPIRGWTQANVEPFVDDAIKFLKWKDYKVTTPLLVAMTGASAGLINKSNTWRTFAAAEKIERNRDRDSRSRTRPRGTIRDADSAKGIPALAQSHVEAPGEEEDQEVTWNKILGMCPKPADRELLEASRDNVIARLVESYHKDSEESFKDKLMEFVRSLRDDKHRYNRSPVDGT